MAASTKLEDAPIAEGTPSSVESSPEPDGLPDASQEQPTQPVKRKGGRKPIYATSEERKQRNRQAQAAFRERRTEYIKQLEANIKQNEEQLSHLQQSQRTAADECLMLRYKNSLLERILLEKGIDVQAELNMKTGSPILGPGFLPPGMSQPRQPPAPLQRTTVQQQHARRTTGQSHLPKLAPGNSNADMTFPQASPQGHPTPPSHASSPSSVPTRSPLTMHQGGITPPTSGVLAQGQVQQYHGFPRSSQQPLNPAYYPPPLQQQTMLNPQPQARPTPPNQFQSNASVISSHSTASQHSSMNPPMTANSTTSIASAVPQPSPASAYYPKQEYDTQQQSMLDEPADPQDQDQDQVSDPSPTQLHGAYPPVQYDVDERLQQQQQQHVQQEYYQQHYNHTQQQHQPATHHPGPTQQQQQQQHHPQYTQPHHQPLMPASRPPTSQISMSAGGGPSGFAGGQMIDPNDPMLDADPFGLSASMHYPTAYSALDQPRLGQQQQQLQHPSQPQPPPPR
ncbi:hypothetical protein LTR86_010344 [Recurvomyces mirabilis]|nr:hypothetical protein LTR86_010344 [Recurvomyces mirabilis]